MKKTKFPKAPKVHNPNPKGNYMKESGKNTKKGGGIDLRRKKLSP